MCAGPRYERRSPGSRTPGAVKIRHRVLQDPHHRVVKELPKTISGKIKRAEIRKDAAQRHKWRHQDVAGMEWAGNE